MRRLHLTMLAFALAAGVNTASVQLQQHHRWLTRLFGHGAWYAHLGLVAPGYVWLFSLLPRLDQWVHWPLPRVARWLTWPLELAAAVLVLGALVQLGPVAALNGSFFGQASAHARCRGVFRWLRNPMYDGYALAFLATACSKTNAAYLLLAAESFALLNVMEASVENRPFQAAGERVPRWLRPF